MPIFFRVIFKIFEAFLPKKMTERMVIATSNTDKVKI